MGCSCRRGRCCIPECGIQVGVCPKCGERPKRSVRAGLCSPCQSAIGKAWREANPERDRELRRAASARHYEKVKAARAEARALRPPPPELVEKRCRGCRAVRPIGDFGGATGREARCSTCRAGQEAWARLQEEKAVWDARGEKRCSRCREVKPWAEFGAHGGQGDGRSPFCLPCSAERRREWVKANPDKAREAKQVRRLGVTRLALFERDHGICHICHKPADFDDFHIDHMFPLAAGGTNDPSNLAVSHPTCNRRKHAKVAPVQLRFAS